MRILIGPIKDALTLASSESLALQLFFSARLQLETTISIIIMAFVEYNFISWVWRRSLWVQYYYLSTFIGLPFAIIQTHLLRKGYIYVINRSISIFQS